MKRVYIAGPMTGLPELNFPAFHAAEKNLRADGFEPVNPVHNGLPREAPWSDHMRADIAMLLTCEAVMMLPGWQKSRGASLERHIAKRLGMGIIYAGAL
jgi:hypothetical protein